MKWLVYIIVAFNKGSSPKRDSSWMLTVLHLIFSRLGIAPWFAYVASKANCSDGPSRLDFSFVRDQLLRSLNEISETVAGLPYSLWALPDCSWWLGWLVWLVRLWGTQVFVSLSLKMSRNTIRVFVVAPV